MRKRVNIFSMAVCALLMPSQPIQAMPGDATAWGARNPGACPAIRPKAAPSIAQVMMMVRCKHEIIVSDGGELWLMQNLNVQMGAPIAFAVAYSTYVMEEADVRSRVYPLRGSFTWSICKTRHDAAIYGNPDLNCYETDVASAKGVCWKTSFGDWRCRLAGSAFGRRDQTSPPKMILPGR